MSVRGKVALITGAGTGIGKATTERMSADGPMSLPASSVKKSARLPATSHNAFSMSDYNQTGTQHWLTVANNSVVSISWLTMQDF